MKALCKVGESAYVRMTRDAFKAVREASKRSQLATFVAETENGASFFRLTWTYSGD